MKYVIAVDCEGPACVVGKPGGSLNDAPAQYEFARRQATAEASAAARGLFAAGATQVIVWDNHGGGVNLVYDELDERCDIFNGVHALRLAMLDETFAGLLFIGYHARDNTVAAPLAHTFNSGKLPVDQNQRPGNRRNGRRCRRRRGQGRARYFCGQ